MIKVDVARMRKCDTVRRFHQTIESGLATGKPACEILWWNGGRWLGIRRQSLSRRSRSHVENPRSTNQTKQQVSKSHNLLLVWVHTILPYSMGRSPNLFFDRRLKGLHVVSFFQSLRHHSMCRVGGNVTQRVYSWEDTSSLALHKLRSYRTARVIEFFMRQKFTKRNGK